MQRFKNARRYGVAAERFGNGDVCARWNEACGRTDRRKRTCHAAPVLFVLQRRFRTVRVRRVHGAIENEHEAIGTRIRQRREYDGLHRAEDGRVYADGDGERSHHQQRRSARACGKAKGVKQVAHDHRTTLRNGSSSDIHIRADTKKHERERTAAPLFIGLTRENAKHLRTVRLTKIGRARAQQNAVERAGEPHRLSPARGAGAASVPAAPIPRAFAPRLRQRGGRAR